MFFSTFYISNKRNFYRLKPMLKPSQPVLSDSNDKVYVAWYTAFTHNHLKIHLQCLFLYAKWFSKLRILWKMTVCYYHVIAGFSVNLHNCLNAMKLLAQNKHNIWSLSDSNEIQTHNHLVCKQTPTIYPNWPI